MKELAFVVKTMREIVKVQPAGYKEVQRVKPRLNYDRETLGSSKSIGGEASLHVGGITA